MPRPTVTCRPATAADVPALLRLYAELHDAAGRAQKVVEAPPVGDLGCRFADLVAAPDAHVILGVVDGTPVGMVVASVIRTDPLSDAESVYLFHMTVTRSARRRGVGQALVRAAADLATERIIDHVVVNPYPSARDANRFFARLGFAPAGVTRVAPTASLRRRLTRPERSPRPSHEALRRRALVLRPAAAGRTRREPAAAGERPTMPG